MLIDSHCHIFLEDFDADREQLMREAFNVGVRRMLLPNVDTTTLKRLFRTIEQYPETCIPMIGLHPTSVDSNYLSNLRIIEQALQNSSPCAIGEIGLDFYWDKTFQKEQIEVFLIQLNWAIQLDLPVSMHIRNAFKEVREVINKWEYREKLRGVFHCFSGDKEDLEWVRQHPNFYIGFTGNITYKHNPINAEFLKDFPIERILVETDCPYLAPCPYRGKRNQPNFLPFTASHLAKLIGKDAGEAEELFSQNTINLFRLPPFLE